MVDDKDQNNKNTGVTDKLKKVNDKDQNNKNTGVTDKLKNPLGGRSFCKWTRYNTNCWRCWFTCLVNLYSSTYIRNE